LKQGNGVWRCRTAFNCTNACPRDIQITRAIGEVKQAIASGQIE
jgi:succinate dehydrogenase / fumarate reductase iron-sulfur subunit